jgi:hypothetical protein
MSILANNAPYRFFVGSAATVRASKEFIKTVEGAPRVDPATQPHIRDEKTGLPIWTVAGELINTLDESVTVVNLKILNETEPVISARTEYTLDGDLFATVYEDKAKKPAVSWKLIGQVVPVGGFPKPHKND